MGPDYAGKIEGMAAAEAGASQEWKDYAMGTILALARKNREFTADEVWAGLAHLGIDGPQEPRAMGPMMRNAAKLGMITKTGYSRVSQQGTNHARPVAIWKSLIEVQTKDAKLVNPLEVPSFKNFLKVCYQKLRNVILSCFGGRR